MQVAHARHAWTCVRDVRVRWRGLVRRSGARLGEGAAALAVVLVVAAQPRGLEEGAEAAPRVVDRERKVREALAPRPPLVALQAARRVLELAVEDALDSRRRRRLRRRRRHRRLRRRRPRLVHRDEQAPQQLLCVVLAATAENAVHRTQPFEQPARAVGARLGGHVLERRAQVGEQAVRRRGGVRVLVKQLVQQRAAQQHLQHRVQIARVAQVPQPGVLEPRGALLGSGHVSRLRRRSCRD